MNNKLLKQIKQSDALEALRAVGHYLPWWFSHSQDAEDYNTALRFIKQHRFTQDEILELLFSEKIESPTDAIERAYNNGIGMAIAVIRGQFERAINEQN